MLSEKTRAVRADKKRGVTNQDLMKKHHLNFAGLAAALGGKKRNKVKTKSRGGVFITRCTTMKKEDAEKIGSKLLAEGKTVRIEVCYAVRVS